MTSAEDISTLAELRAAIEAAREHDAMVDQSNATVLDPDGLLPAPMDEPPDASAPELTAVEDWVAMVRHSTAQRDAALVAAYAAGHTLREVGAAASLTHEAVRYVLLREGVTLRRGGRSGKRAAASAPAAPLPPAAPA